MHKGSQGLDLVEGSGRERQGRDGEWDGGNEKREAGGKRIKSCGS